MKSVYGTIFAWILRHTLLLSAITLIFMMPWLFPAQFDAFKKFLRELCDPTIGERYEIALRDMEERWAELRGDMQRDLQELDGMPKAQLKARIDRVSAALANLSCSPWPAALATANSEALLCHVERSSKEAELELLRDLIDTLSTRDELEQRMRLESNRFDRLETELTKFERKYWPWYEIPFTVENARHLKLVDQRNRQLRVRDRAIEAFRKGPPRIPAKEIWAEIAQREDAKVEARVADIRARIGQLEKSLVHKIPEALSKALPIAALFVLFLVSVPILLKAILYFVFARIAEGRQGVVLVPRKAPRTAAAGRLDSPAHMNREISGVSVAVSVNPGNELILHSDYVQSTARGGDFGTRWFLDSRHPLTSMACRMIALTRVRSSQVPTKVVVSNKNDPHSEIGTINLGVDASLVLLPHNLVGVLQDQAQPVRVTPQWRLGSLTAWLTLQLRYLVFHGPGILIVQGCRGVRVEQADGGRSVDQAATIGFEGHLVYSVSRCETFTAFLLGKHGLFNDHFSGGPGFYVYEEMPRFGKRTGIYGRGLEGLLDAGLRIFGI